MRWNNGTIVNLKICSGVEKEIIPFGKVDSKIICTMSIQKQLENSQRNTWI